jgi:hypothetical protein
VPPPPTIGPADPNGIAALSGRISGGSRRSARAAILVASVLLEDGERAEQLVVGRVGDHPAALVLTDRRLLVVDEREWRPGVTEIPLTPGLVVQGMADDRAASLTFSQHGVQVAHVDHIGDIALAQQLAAAVRSRVG